VSEQAAPLISHESQEHAVPLHGMTVPDWSWLWQTLLQQLALLVQGPPKLEHVCAGQHEPSVHVLVLSQQSPFVEHGSYGPAQVVPDCWQVPAVAPGGMRHDMPTQQSLVRVQLAPFAWHGVGVEHVPELQRPPQHCDASVQAPPSARHAGGLHTPDTHVLVPQQGRPLPVVHAAPSPMHEPDPVVSAQMKTLSNCVQASPVQQDVSLVPEHVAPSALQTGAGVAQRSTPAASGTHGAPSQHWSRNWQTAPAAMQQSGSEPS
jgi:hypothetical protein